jgi:hypothetical protein
MYLWIPYSTTLTPWEAPWSSSYCKKMQNGGSLCTESQSDVHGATGWMYSLPSLELDNVNNHFEIQQCEELAVNLISQCYEVEWGFGFVMWCFYVNSFIVDEGAVVKNKSHQVEGRFIPIESHLTYMGFLMLLLESMTSIIFQATFSPSQWMSLCT